jgi:hypothetical protein
MRIADENWREEIIKNKKEKKTVEQNKLGIIFVLFTLPVLELFVSLIREGA